MTNHLLDRFRPKELRTPKAALPVRRRQHRRRRCASPAQPRLSPPHGSPFLQPTLAGAQNTLAYSNGTRFLVRRLMMMMARALFLPGRRSPHLLPPLAPRWPLAAPVGCVSSRWLLRRHLRRRRRRRHRIELLWCPEGGRGPGGGTPGKISKDKKIAGTGNKNKRAPSGRRSCFGHSVAGGRCCHPPVPPLLLDPASPAKRSPRLRS